MEASPWVGMEYETGEDIQYLRAQNIGKMIYINNEITEN